MGLEEKLFISVLKIVNLRLNDSPTHLSFWTFAWRAQNLVLFALEVPALVFTFSLRPH